MSSVLRHGWIVALALGCGVPDEAAPGERPKPPIQPGPLGLRVECEQLEGTWERQTNLPGFSGTGFAVSNAVGAPAESQISGKIEVLEPGRYRVWARGFEGGGADRSWQLRIGELQLPPTHAGVDAESFSWQLAGSVELAGGVLEIAVSDGGWGLEVADAIALTTDADYDPNVDDANWLVLDTARAKKTMLDSFVATAKAYGQAIPTPASLEEWGERAAEIRPRLLSALGLDPLPEATALNATLLGHVERSGYRIERVVFESRPDFPVTANVYVPDGSGPFPLVVVPVGHWPAAKSDPEPSAVAHGLALRGFIVIIYDPFGQGEREIPGNDHNDHALYLSGHSNMSIMIWDTVRALDYMLTRSDVDGARVGLTGASGGGLNTLYASVVDARFDVAVPAIYISQFEPFIATGIGHCACSHVPGVAAISDMGEISALFAPRPQAYLNAVSDPMFTLKGASLAEQQARVVYDLFGAGSALELRTFAGGHALGQPMREALYGILEHRLLEQGSGEPVPEPSFEPLPENSPELNCFESGKIPSSSKTVRDLAREWAREAVLKLPGPQQLLADATRAKLEALVAPQAASMPVVRSLGTVRVGEIEAEKFEIEPEPGVVLPAHAIISDPSAPIVVLADGLPAVLAGAELSWAARSHGLNALYVAPRGQGETLWPGKDHVVLTNGILLGHPIAGQRAFDLMQAARVASGLVAPNTRVGLVAVSNAALPGLLAQAIWQPFAASAIGPIPSTFLDKFEATLDTSAHIAGILEVADIPQVVSLAASAPLLVQFQTDTHRQFLPEWASWLDQQAELASEIDARESLAWMSARFGVTASKQ